MNQFNDLAQVLAQAGYTTDQENTDQYRKFLSALHAGVRDLDQSQTRPGDLHALSRIVTAAVACLYSIGTDVPAAWTQCIESQLQYLKNNHSLSLQDWTPQQLEQHLL